MKKRFVLSRRSSARTLLLLLSALLVQSLLSGCSAFGTSFSKLEQLRIVQTLGVDSSPAGVRLSLATAQEANSADAVCLSADGPTLAAALTRVQNRSTEENLFCGHIQQLVIGERVDLGPLLRTIGRSADLRLDTPLWLVRDASAETVMSGSGSGSHGITEILAAVQAQLDRSGGSEAFTAGHILQDLQRQGSSLVCVLNYTDAAERPNSAPDARSGGAEPARTALLAGFAVIQEGAVRSYLKAEDLLGIGLLRNRVGIQQLDLRDRNGANAVLEIRQGSTRLRPVWTEAGDLQGLDISVRVDAILLEGDSRGLSDAYIDDLTAKLEAAVSEQLRGLLRRSKALRADFLGLGARVEAASPLAFRRLDKPFTDLLPGVEISLSVQGSLQHEYDMK